MNKSTSIENNMEIANHEAQMGHVKIKKDNLTIDTVSQDVESRLTLKTDNLNEERQANGLHQVNGVLDSPKKSSELSSIVSVPQGVASSHKSQLDNVEETASMESKNSDIMYVSYTSELQMPDIMKLIQKDLSEPYSIYTYRYFIHNWPKLCFLAMHEEECVGAIVCKLDIHRKVIKRGYIAMLAVDVKYRKRKIGSNLVRRAIQAMVADDADEVVLETEITNRPALRLYENLGFVRDKRLFRYYLNGVDALRLKLWLR
ncbi:N-alpha-acetyltransferase 30 [Diprion similis]|uniref:N-alpha-acetyltransferase 30 n=1 Tax=Diprion similis TaxID=362088 RepID=UPI001EF87467|nr:N-alpha-acetyltransferase 30 [Diprion similis]